MNTNVGIGIGTLRDSRFGSCPPADDCAKMVKRSPVCDQLERLEKNISTIGAAIAAHGERLESCLSRHPEEPCPKKDKPKPCGECGLSDRLLRFNEDLEGLTATVARLTSKVCL